MRRNAYRLAAAAALVTVIAVAPDAAHAATGGGGMPWDSGLNQLSTSARTTLAAAFIILGCIGGLIEYMNNGHLSTLLMVLGRSGMVIGVIGGIIAFMGLFGMTGALVA